MINSHKTSFSSSYQMKSLLQNGLNAIFEIFKKGTTVY